MATATNFMKFSWLFRSCYNFSLTNGTQFGNDSNYSWFNEENTANSRSMVARLALGRLTNIFWPPRYLEDFFLQITK